MLQTCTKHGGVTSYDTEVCPRCAAEPEGSRGLHLPDAPQTPPDKKFIVEYTLDALMVLVHKRLSSELEEFCTEFEQQMEFTFSNLVRSLRTKALTVAVSAPPAAAVSGSDAADTGKHAPPLSALDHSPEP